VDWINDNGKQLKTFTMSSDRLQAALPRVVPGTYYLKHNRGRNFQHAKHNPSVNADSNLKSAIATQWRFYFICHDCSWIPRNRTADHNRTGL